MGMFDTMYLKCPHCGKDAERQTKQFDCMLDHISLNEEQPTYMASHFVGEWECDKCKKSFWVSHQLPKLIRLKTHKENPDW